MYQNERLIQYLQTHESLSVAEAPSRCGIGCLTKRVRECREMGFNIKSYKVEEDSFFGGKVKYNRYFLDKPERLV